MQINFIIILYIISTSERQNSFLFTLPVICVQGSLFSKVDNVSGSNHGNLSSDLQFSAVRDDVGSVIEDSPIP